MASARELALPIGGVAVGTGLMIAGVWIYLNSDQRSNTPTPISERLRAMVNHTPPTPVQPTREMLEHWLVTPGELHSLAHKPADARLVPVVARRWTPMVPRTARTNLGSSAAGRLAYLNAIRNLMQTAGRGSEDPRCALCLFANESGWDQFGWCYNFGNVKSQGAIYADRTTLLEDPSGPHVYTTRPESNGVYLLTDSYTSFDGYHAFADAAEYMRYHGGLLARRFPEVQNGYRQGGLDGLLHAEEWIARYGYAERPYDQDPANMALPARQRRRISMQDYVFARQREARGYWSNMTHLLGGSFVR